MIVLFPYNRSALFSDVLSVSEVSVIVTKLVKC